MHTGLSSQSIHQCLKDRKSLVLNYHNKVWISDATYNHMNIIDKITIILCLTSTTSLHVTSNTNSEELKFCLAFHQCLKATLQSLV